MPKTDKEILDEALAEQRAGTYVDPVASAKRFLGKETVVDRASRNAGMAPNEETGMYEPRIGPTQHSFGEDFGQTVGETASAMMLPLAFASGPFGVIAGGSASLEGLMNAAKNPSALNIGMAAAGLIPGLKALRGKFGKAAGVGDEIAATARAGKVPTLDDVVNGSMGIGKKGAPVMDEASQRAAMFEDVMSRQPKAQPTGTTFDMTGNRGRVGYNNPTEFTPESPVERYMANTPGNVTRGVEGAENLQPSVSRWTPNTPGDVTRGVEGAEQIPSSIDRYMPNAPGELSRGIESAPGVANRVLTGADQFPHVTGRIPAPHVTARGTFNTQTPTLVDELPLEQGLPTPEDVPSLQGLMESIGEVPMSRKAGRAKRLDDISRFHAEEFRRRQAHGSGGFSMQQMPEMSPAEVDRISAAIARITGQ